MSLTSYRAAPPRDKPLPYMSFITFCAGNLPLENRRFVPFLCRGAPANCPYGIEQVRVDSQHINRGGIRCCRRSRAHRVMAQMRDISVARREVRALHASVGI